VGRDQTSLESGDNRRCIQRTTDGGITWRPSWENFDDHDPGQAAAYDAIVEGDLTLLSVSFSDANTGTVVGDGGVILRTTDGGATWRLQPSGTSNSLLGVYFTDATTGTVVGETGTILRTRTGGQPPASATPAASNRRF
jgi:photosystem II stability/assembly factor-like uncharacterized protein